MLIKHSNNDKQRQAPNSYNQHERTYNHAIDLVGEAIGWGMQASAKQIAAVKLKPTAYRNFCEGVKLLLKRRGGTGEIEPGTQMEWLGYPVLEGSRAQIETIVIEYVENQINPLIVR